MEHLLSPSPRRRSPAVAALAATAGIHIALAPDHLREAPYAGALFVALGAAALALAALLAVCDHRLVWLGGGVLSLAAVLAYVASRSIGLPSLADDVGDWLDPLGVAALVSETATAWLCCYTLLSPGRGTRRTPRAGRAWSA